MQIIEGVVNPVDINDPNINPKHKEFLLLKLKKKQLETEIEKCKKEIEKLEKHYLRDMAMGKSFNWCWESVITRTNISWKDLFIEYVGKKEADKVASTIPVNKYPHIHIRGYDPEIIIKPTRFRLSRKKIGP